MIESRCPGVGAGAARWMLRGLPPAPGYRVLVAPLRYRTRPHLAGRTEFDERRIVLQVPEPFLPFGEIVPYRAIRRPGRALRFVWLTEGVTFRTEREVLRFLYCHEWLHWYVRERLGRRGSAETACDRFALANYLRPLVTEADAQAALRPGSRTAERELPGVRSATG